MNEIVSSVLGSSACEARLDTGTGLVTALAHSNLRAQGEGEGGKA